MKFPYLRSARARTPAGTGSGRWRGCRTATSSPRRWPKRERREFVAWGRGEPVHATLAYHWARMIEVLHTIEVIARAAGRPGHPGRRAHGWRRRCRRSAADGEREGVGVIEAPRGTLIHHYRGRRRRPGHDVQPDRLHHPQQPGDERGGALGGAPVLRRPRDHRGPAQPHRGRDPRLRPLPVLRHPCAGPDAAGRGAGRRRRRAARPCAAPRRRPLRARTVP